MEAADKKHLYISLLQGIANECQDRLCAQDMQHAWGPVKRWRVEHDHVPRGPVSVGDACNEQFIVAGERTCQNCGKVEAI